MAVTIRIPEYFSSKEEKAFKKGFRATRYFIKRKRQGKATNFKRF